MATAGRDRRFDAALDMLARELPRLRGEQAATRLAALRRQAMAGGLLPAAELAGGLEASIRRDRAGTPVGAWMEAIHLAADCDPHDRATVPLLLARIGARMAG